jgi:signal peptidase II
MKKRLIIFFGLFISMFAIDQYIKSIFVNGYGLDGECISLVLAYNKGVAFSMFSFLEGNLKYIQIVMLSAITIFVFYRRQYFLGYYIPLALLLAGGFSNIYDRFIHIGVVDYVYWHCRFDFAIFNFADVIIDIAVVLMLYISWKYSPEEKQPEEFK